MPSNTPDFYVYALFRETGVPFYVGKGRNGRWLLHEWEAKTSGKGRRHRIIRRMQERGIEVPKIKLHEGLTEATAFAYEIALIDAIGRTPRGPLVNHTNGGEGASGLEVSEETRAKMSARLRGVSKSPEHRAKIAAAHRDTRPSAEALAKAAATNRGRKHTPEVRAQFAASRTGKVRSPEAVAKTAAANRGQKRSAETRAKIAAARRGKPWPMKMREKIDARRSATHHSPQLTFAGI